MESIGQILKAEREKRGLSLEEVHESTKITVQNVEALEHDRFDHFPNRVYARAFLRDYSNFLGLDSAELLTRYEDEWIPAVETAMPAPARRPAWRTIVVPLIGLLVIGALLAAGYVGWGAYERGKAAPKVPVAAHADDEQGGATLPNVEPVPPPKPKPETPPAPKPEPAKPVVPEKLVLDVTATRDVWTNVKADGKTAFEGTLAQGQTKTFEARSEITIRTGMAGAVQLKLNGQPQPPLGSLQEIGQKTYKLPQQPPAQDGAASGSAPATGGTP